MGHRDECHLLKVFREKLAIALTAVSPGRLSLFVELTVETE
jgi:hypothetical protein